MDVSGIGSSSKSTFSSFVDNPNSALGKTDFLELLVTKLKFQDPLKPMTDESFIADMAQFSSLEQMTNLNDSYGKQSTSMDNLNQNLLALIIMQNTTQAAGLIGKTVKIEYTETALDGSKTVKTVTGPVDVVKFVDGQPKLVVNGNLYGLADVKEISA